MTDVYILKRPKDPTAAVTRIARKYTDKPLTIERNSDGKPFFNIRNLHFNISHSGSKWVIAISKYPVGVDIEKMTFRDFDRIVARIGTKKEIQHFVGSKNKKNSFYLLWTRKEAISKCIGKGFKYGFKKINTLKWNTQTYIFGKFILTVASKNKKEKFSIANSSASLTFRKVIE